MNNKFLTGQDVIKEPCSGYAIAGFNRKVYGHTYLEAFRFENEKTNPDLHGGWNLAEKLIDEGKIYYVHNFHSTHDPRGCKGHAFQYGGSFVCNECGRNHLEQDWWKIRVFKDGNAWCCVGTDFENLQESSNFAFGDSKNEAINNYGDLMVKENDPA